jgi:outer membrane protein, multidrug efflux system
VGFSCANGQMLSQEIVLTKVLGSDYRADPPVELTSR